MGTPPRQRPDTWRIPRPAPALAGGPPPAEQVDLRRLGTPPKQRPDKWRIPRAAPALAGGPPPAILPTAAPHVRRLSPRPTSRERTPRPVKFLPASMRNAATAQDDDWSPPPLVMPQREEVRWTTPVPTPGAPSGILCHADDVRVHPPGQARSPRPAWPPPQGVPHPGDPSTWPEAVHIGCQWNTTTRPSEESGYPVMGGLPQPQEADWGPAVQRAPAPSSSTNDIELWSPLGPGSVTLAHAGPDTQFHWVRFPDSSDDEVDLEAGQQPASSSNAGNRYPPLSRRVRLNMAGQTRYTDIRDKRR